MTIVYEERPSDSPYVETVTRGWTAGDGATIRPAESHWHMVSVRHNGDARLLVVGPLTTAGAVSWTAGAEIVWIRFKLGAFMPHLPARTFLNTETVLPEATSRSFWLKGSAWRFPGHDDIEAFVDGLVRNGVLVRDPVVDAALRDRPLSCRPARCGIGSCGPPARRGATFARSNAPSERRRFCGEASRSRTPSTTPAISTSRT